MLFLFKSRTDNFLVWNDCVANSNGSRKIPKNDQGLRVELKNDLHFILLISSSAASGFIFEPFTAQDMKGKKFSSRLELIALDMAWHTESTLFPWGQTYIGLSPYILLYIVQVLSSFLI